MGADVSAEYSSILCSLEERTGVVVKQKKEGHISVHRHEKIKAYE
jgi:hypothetical protein